MPRVETTVLIEAPIERVYEIAKDNEAFPEYMKDVQSLTIVERDGGRIVSDWVGVVSAFNVKVRWRQEDLWDDSAKVCRFRQVSGDYDSMSGEWTFREEAGGTRFESVLDYEYSVPGIGALVKKVLHGLVVKNMDDTLKAIKGRAEQG
ncbi:MAG: SRPBCC family protein [Fimbriimonadaceae bacterium]|nr:SRPBCC family protein [Fimbriimonadaceae bacterium]QYK56744.1 MAG: SRPBCC family protein [Fimbriimonadaceae bacterium]